MIITIMLINTSITLYSYHPVCVCVCVCVNVCVVRTFKTYSFSNFQVSIQFQHNTVLLTTVTMLYTSSQKLTHIITESLDHFPKSPLVPQPPAPMNHNTTLCFYEFLSGIDYNLDET